MSQAISNLDELLRTMNATREPGVYAYVSVPHETDVSALPYLALFREREGISLIVAEEVAQQAGLAMIFRCAWISLTVHSDLEACGLTTAFSTALSAQGISCNVVAAAFHDHIFVPLHRADDAIACLDALSASRSRSPS
ncbi:ACT domain-containing protein [Undibacterium cyanobacteriorum]|uniref:ACT domain-containing protein n=1 Tax=Undibacterium cyanobacteriorum TaxID=3073561 RepID=A0ABY9RIS2_9BURK|nr:ACT domain-containing protein [Undibacterium sp. 20NA77.5]WMW80565.1 ACT domain-containing protein [Undibacterium sp. 20NA77.5]